MGSVTLDIRCDCGRVYHASSEQVGRRIKCTNCGRLVEVKAPSNGNASPSLEAIHAESTVRQSRTVVPKPIARRGYSRWALWLTLALAAILIAAVINSRKTGNSQTTTVKPTSAPDSYPTQISGTPSEEDNTSNANDCPASPHSLSNGAKLQPDVGTNGHGTLTVDNGTSDDATVELVNTDGDYTSRYAYIPANHKLKLTGIEAGTYHLMFSSGANWVGDDFTCSQSYSEFERELVYSELVEGNKHEFHEMSITLHPVLQGNVKTRPISRADFHRHKQRVVNSSQ